MKRSGASSPHQPNRHWKAKKLMPAKVKKGIATCIMVRYKRRKTISMMGLSGALHDLSSIWWQRAG